MRKVTPKMTIGDGDSEVFCMKFDPEDRYLACGYGDGMTRIYNVDSGKLSYTLSGLSGNDEMPVTCLNWRPTSASLKTANVLVTGAADGALKHWHATSGKCLHSKIEDPENHIYCMDFNPDGTLLAVGGRDMHIRIYDETTKSLAFKMKDLGELPGHSNRIFCVKFNKSDPNMVASGGWDNTVQINDLRYRGPVRSIYGPHICGECIDFRSDGVTMVTGSFRMEDVMEVWDLRMFRRTRVIPWEGSGSQEVLMYDEDATDMEGAFTDVEEAKSERPQSSAFGTMPTGPIRR
jgi:WD40 repeat protein